MKNWKSVCWLLLIVVQPRISARVWPQHQNSEISRGLARRDERDNIGTGRPRSDISIVETTDRAVSFESVRCVAIVNVFLNALRPDPAIIWQVREEAGRSSFFSGGGFEFVKGWSSETPIDSRS